MDVEEGAGRQRGYAQKIYICRKRIGYLVE
jgi:ribosomal protein S14